MADSKSGRGLIRGYIYVMLTLAVGCGVAAAYLHAKDDHSVQKLTEQLPAVGIAAADVRAQLAPSIREFEKKKQSGTISGASKQEMSATPQTLDAALLKLFAAHHERPALKYSIGRVNDGSTKTGGVKGEFYRVELPVKLAGVTQLELEAVMQLVQENHGSYATVESLDFKPGKQANDKSIDEKKQLTGKLESFSVQYDASFLLVWHIVAPKAAPATPAGKEDKPSA
jgi:hypothetical protein